jgi:hypothetical protein
MYQGNSKDYETSFLSVHINVKVWELPSKVNMIFLFVFVMKVKFDGMIIVWTNKQRQAAKVIT